MQIKKTYFDKVLLLEPKVHGDHRGFFVETYNQQSFKKIGIELHFVQDNHSLSAQRGTLRGLHYQNLPKAQSKLVRCIRGKILDVAVDIRKGSPTFGKYVAVELTAENKLQLLVPAGFAHGFVTLEENTEVCYKVDEFYSPEHDRSILWNDPQIQIDWKVESPVLSEKDLKAPLLSQSDFNFSF